MADMSANFNAASEGEGFARVGAAPAGRGSLEWNGKRRTLAALDGLHRGSPGAPSWDALGVPVHRNPQADGTKKYTACGARPGTNATIARRRRTGASRHKVARARALRTGRGVKARVRGAPRQITGLVQPRSGIGSAAPPTDDQLWAMDRPATGLGQAPWASARPALLSAWPATGPAPSRLASQLREGGSPSPRARVRPLRQPVDRSGKYGETARLRPGQRAQAVRPARLVRLSGTRNCWPTASGLWCRRTAELVVYA